MSYKFIRGITDSLTWIFFFNVNYSFSPCFCAFSPFWSKLFLTSCNQYIFLCRLFLSWRMKLLWWRESTATFSCTLQEQTGGVRILACGKPSLSQARYGVLWLFIFWVSSNLQEEKNKNLYMLSLYLCVHCVYFIFAWGRKETPTSSELLCFPSDYYEA